MFGTRLNWFLPSDKSLPQLSNTKNITSANCNLLWTLFTLVYYRLWNHKYERNTPLFVAQSKHYLLSKFDFSFFPRIPVRIYYIFLAQNVFFLSKENSLMR